MKRFFEYSFLIFSALLNASLVQSASKLDVGADYRLRGIYYSNPTYTSETPIGSGKTIEQRYYTHRAKIYIKGKFDPQIEVASVIQAIGLSGSTQSFQNRYPKEDFSPFIENAYLRGNELFDLPINLTIGRQPYVWGSGLLISDDGLGFDGIRIDMEPFWGIGTHLFTSKAKERINEGDKDLYLGGLSYTWGIHNLKLGWIVENDQSGSLYSTIDSTTPEASDKISRQFYDFQLAGTLEKGAFYTAEYVIQSGKAKTFTKENTLSGSALTFEGGFDFIHPRYKRMHLAFVFMQGSGDSSATTNEDEKFSPSFGHKFDGLERSGKGEFFAANPYSFFNDDKVIIPIKVGDKVTSTRPYSSLFSGVRMFGFRGFVKPWDNFLAGLEYYLYSAMQKSELGVGAPTITENALGRELVIKAEYDYRKKISFAVRWGKFFPSPTLNDVGSSRLIFEAQGKF